MRSVNQLHVEDIDPGIDPPLAGGVGLVAEIRTNPLALLAQQARLHGDIFAYETGHYKTVVLNHPALVRHVLVDYSDRYSKVGTPELDMLRSVLGDGLMTVEGEEWTAQRALATPHFSEEFLRSCLAAMEAEIGTLLDQWAALEGADDGLCIGDSLSALTLRIVARCLFATGLTQEEADDVGTGVGALNEFMASGPEARGADHNERSRAMEKMAGIVWSMVCAGEPPGAIRESLLGAMLRNNTRRDDLRPIVDQVLTFLMAGHETTAKALTWVLHLLGSRPDLQQALWEEAHGAGADGRGYGDLSRLTDFESILYEAMRLYPPVWMISRKAICDDRIGSYRIGHGALVIISPFMLHRHAELWPDPTRFDASRFANGAGRFMRECSYLPFGAGPRTCIGRRFAMQEMTLFLVMLVRRFQFQSLNTEAVHPEALVTLRPASDIRVRLKRR